MCISCFLPCVFHVVIVSCFMLLFCCVCVVVFVLVLLCVDWLCLDLRCNNIFLCLSVHPCLSFVFDLCTVALMRVVVVLSCGCVALRFFFVSCNVLFIVLFLLLLC